MTEPEYEYAVRWKYSSGPEFISAGYTATGAAKTLRAAGDPKTHQPFAAEAVRRPVAAWSPVPPEGKTQR